MTDTFKDLGLTQARGKTEPHIRQPSVDDLPGGDVLGVLVQRTASRPSGPCLTR